jgi:hypothetical protein
MMDSVNVNALLELVETVNATELKEEDKLTDSVYIYGADGLTIAA